MGRLRHLILLLPILCLACSRPALVHSFLPVPEDGWRRTDTLVFPLPPAQDEAQCSLYVGLRLHNRFPLREVWLGIEHRMGTDEGWSCDTLCLRLSDEKGRLSGQGINLLQYEVAAGSLHMPAGQEGELRIHHLMRCETLPDIMEVGIRLSR
ncbi:MAG: gliding motility lipoprotein GldH [Bacteroidaceae bacterium]|nr:gliding motility lipoprotein GldH [Bacteroidaceae bacterium]